MQQKVTAWSYSRWNEYEACPAKTKFKVIDKLKEPSSPALERGTAIHAKAEQYLRTGGRVPKEIHKDLHPYYKALRAENPHVELEICFNREWKNVDWFARDAWCRIKVDAMVAPKGESVLVRVVDHKTGKLKEYAEYERQMELYGLAGLLTCPTAQEVSAELAFTDHGKVVQCVETYKRKDESKMIKLWEQRTKPMLADTRFAPNPGNACRWCSFRKANNGPCTY